MSNKKLKTENGSISVQDTHIKEEKDDDDDDIPLSELIKKKNNKNNNNTTTTTATTTSTSNSNIKIKSESIKTEKSQTTTTKTTTTKPETVSDDSDDDVPISELIKRKKDELAIIETKVKTETKTKSKNETKSKTTTKESKTKSKTVTTTTAKVSRASEKKNASSQPSDAFYCCKKGKLVQKLLVRWWYAINWPDEESINNIPDGGYEPLDGFPGVFICTNIENLGKIIDNRDPETCPSLRNLSKKSSAELQSLCITAYTEQIRELIEHEGEEIPLVKLLKKELKEVKAIDPRSADNESIAKKSRF